MPFFNMFKSRRARTTSLPRAPERYLHESEVYNQASAYGPRSTSGFGRSAHLAQPHAGSRAQRHTSHSSSFSNSVPERYAESPTNDQSWYRVEHPDYSGYRGPRDRDPEDFSYSEEGDRHSDGSVSGPGVPIHTLSESTGTGVESPVPTVYRQGSPQSSSRMYEQLVRSPRIPASVTRLDLHEGVEGGYDGGYDRHRRGLRGRDAWSSSSSAPTAIPTPRLPASDVVQMMDNGERIPIPRHSLERRRIAPRESYNYDSNNKRTYYIVPPGMSVIFRDEHGNELKRQVIQFTPIIYVGDFSGGGDDDRDTYDEAPVELTDEQGRIVYKRVGCDYYPPRGKSLTDMILCFRTGENYTDDGSDVSEATHRPQVVHLGQYLSTGRSADIPSRSVSPITVSLDRRGYHRHIQLDPSEDGSFGGSQQETDRSFSPPRLSHTRSEGHLAGFGSLVRPHLDQVKLRTVYP
ncbi:hypothetical protein F5888DRAFT_1798494 [Russula emetica]|nr:hypothetical protein F5888DRAFT_1798494 [Russula emetica]